MWIILQDFVRSVYFSLVIQLTHANHLEAELNFITSWSLSFPRPSQRFLCIFNSLLAPCNFLFFLIWKCDYFGFRYVTFNRIQLATRPSLLALQDASFSAGGKIGDESGRGLLGSGRPQTYRWSACFSKELRLYRGLRNARVASLLIEMRLIIPFENLSSPNSQIRLS